MREYSYYVGGEFRKSGNKLKVIDPSTEEEFAQFFESEKKDVDFALLSARSAQKEWKKVSFKERAKTMREISRVMVDNLSDLANLESKEIGKILKESLFVDISLGADCFNYYASYLESLEEKSLQSDLGLDIIKYDPFGVCAVYLPYNVPLMIFGFSCAAALAAGNALIVKPSEYGTLSMLELARYIDKLEIPKGLINIITGKGESTGAYLAKSKVDIISFTGSRYTLKKIIETAKDNPKKIICELGGCNITAVFSDADNEEALQNVLASSFMKQGQLCIGTSMLLVEEEIYPEFINNLKAKAESIKIGDPFDPTVGMGPLISRNHLSAVEDKIKDVITKGAKLISGNKRTGEKGYFLLPTILEIKDVIYEEFFAPVILIKKCGAFEIESIIENNPTGLVTQIWTNDLAKAHSIANKANCGTVWINTFAQMNSQTPFGGTGSSGWGRNLGEAGFFEYVQLKHVGVGFEKSPVSGWFGI